MAATIEEEIVEWSTSRPPWQRTAMRRVARGDALSEPDFVEIANQLVNALPFSEFVTLADVPRGQPSVAGSLVLRGIRDLSHVNALIPNQLLDFAATGLTVIYGDNGSGKSGYARLLKAVVRARDQEEVRSDIFSDAPDEQPSATLLVERGGVAVELAWPDGDVDDLAAMGFYDERCGDKYLTTDAEISYRPSALSILDGLIRACDGVRAVLDRRLLENARRAARLPELNANTDAARFLATLTSSSDRNQLDQVCGMASTAEEIARLVDEEAQLRTLDPARERARLLGLATKLERLATHMTRVAASIGVNVESEMRRRHGGLRAAEAAATLASEITFEHEPLAGVGSSAWKVLWDAARRYSAEGAALEGEFPQTERGARCVLCQQELGADAIDRLRRFDAFVRDDVQAALADARGAWDRVLASVRGLACTPPDVAALLDDLQEWHGALVQNARGFLEACARRQAALVAASGLAMWPSGSIAPPPSPPAASEAAAETRAQAGAIETRDHEQTIRDVVGRRQAAEDATKLASRKADVISEIDRLVERGLLDAAKAQTATTGVSSKIADLMRAHVTTVVRDRFTRETDRLGLERVTLNDLGVRKGALRQQAGFVGARQQAALPHVLSEGEQTALGLAGFFTEAYLDASRAAMVLDDPVSSLDHRRRAKVAARLAEFAKDRQVVVFTHDIAFVGELAKAAEAGPIPMAERSVERAGTGKPGACHPYHPWKARDVPQRLNDLGAELAKLKTDQANLDQAGYETRSADWAGKLSETWERILVLEVVGKVFDLGTQEARPRMFRLLSKITEADDTDFQASYGRCSQWARRHDKSLAVNYIAPTIDEMRSELEFVKAWFDRVRKYKNN